MNFESFEDIKHLMDNFDPASLLPDLSSMAGLVATITRLKDRVHVIHLKDGLRNGHGFALGEGEAPVAAVREKAIELGMHMVVESETLQPDGISEVTRCFNYLKSLEK